MAADAGNRLAWEAKLKEAVMLQKMEYTMVVQVHKLYMHMFTCSSNSFSFLTESSNRPEEIENFAPYSR
jgi:hypothetical protein